MFVSSCTEFRCMFINVSDRVFPFHSLAPVLREALAVFGNRAWRRVGWCYQPGGQPEHSSCLCLEALPRQTWRPIVGRGVRQE